MTLHCPATLLVAPRPADEGSVRSLLEGVRRERVITVVGAPGDELAALASELLDVPLEEDPDLGPGCPDDAVLTGIADLHRGETVLVLTQAAEDAGAVGEVSRVELGDD